MPAVNPCSVIPVFNHPHKIAGLVDRLIAYGLPCILVDDGSGEDCARVLDEIAAAKPQVILLRLPQNSGKGVAVCRGLTLAHERGFTHALQVDADGQHDLDDVPRFLARAQQQPLAVVSGWRSYEAMPPSRRSGRKLTDFWVCVNTLSRSIHDSMCGYRLYPLAPTMHLLARKKIGARMDFDTDILVRLYWQGLAVENIPTQILYQDDIPSHFDIVKDNVRISWMHTRLFFGMLVRIPVLLQRHSSRRQRL
ncbi:glycosyltransferase family 2 protein [Cellvibrio japonicus]|uniref:Glycosyl transferase, putative, gt2J n=1 Tax=Cellvibrio japonicus (strain Ueda107) TaxID=498211 RepID=B3PFJ4_CELJU|nr:glycosyltransferase family 2 protein [Cellvibrio japonicus]ACE83568.1 glycosyl transferase, putative, gt2J [Cellvibrio japonicus Ueda107]QEI10859.1 glycosyltransferase family 2 protein [Cellvibrio japonicus]QEI14435.1 glycosyltransferase family 2 protein [Cellvibrio japonicus]QEI18013.1 glycosyltransferase family 2 protein [Cellvibrio japonicus]